MPNAGKEHKLEQLSQEAAERYQAPPAPAWEKMEQVLDREMPVEKQRRRRFLFWWLLPLALGTAWLGYRQFAGNNHQPVTTHSKPSPKNTPGNITNTQSQPDQQTGQDHENSSAVAVNSRNANTNIQTATPGGNPAPINRMVEPQKTNTSGSSSQTNTTAASSTTNTATDNNTTLTPPSTPVRSTEPAQQMAVTQAQNNPVNTATATQASAVDTSQQPVTAIDTTNPPLPTERAATKKPNRGRGLSFGLIAGLDQSTVKFKYGERMGYNIGLGIGYHFNDHWSLHTGAIYTQKNYKMDGADFHAPKGSWLNNYKLETVDGYCRMWEFPLSMRYSTGKFFTSAGLSSYLMQQEQYNYFYYYNNNPVTRKAIYNTSSTYLFSVVSISAGFEQRISNKISLLTEPYAKLPLLGLGHGSAKLSSFGLNFFVQYRQPAKKQLRTRE
ncbi:MAG: outer membrane beta-barrel protein [Chitinophagaceae bacterium]|nr:outer membrane beta-barrel protein [Chitinophagaceae bacterium]